MKRYQLHVASNFTFSDYDLPTTELSLQKNRENLRTWNCRTPMAENSR